MVWFFFQSFYLGGEVGEEGCKQPSVTKEIKFSDVYYQSYINNFQEPQRNREFNSQDILVEELLFICWVPKDTVPSPKELAFCFDKQCNAAYTEHISHFQISCFNKIYWPILVSQPKMTLTFLTQLPITIYASTHINLITTILNGFYPHHIPIRQGSILHWKIMSWATVSPVAKPGNEFTAPGHQASALSPRPAFLFYFPFWGQSGHRSSPSPRWVQMDCCGNILHKAHSVGLPP